MRSTKGDNGSGHGNESPGVTSEAFTGSERHEMIIALGVAGVAEGDGAGVAGFGGIGGVVIFKDLDVRAKLEFEVIEIGAWAAGHDGKRAHCGGNAIVGREHIEKFGCCHDELADHETGQTTKRQAMDHGADTLLDCADGTFDFPNMIVGGSDVEMRG